MSKGNNKQARTIGKNKARYALYLPMWCRCTTAKNKVIKRQTMRNGGMK